MGVLCLWLGRGWERAWFCNERFFHILAKFQICLTFFGDVRVGISVLTLTLPPKRSPLLAERRISTLMVCCLLKGQNALVRAFSRNLVKAPTRYWKPFAVLHLVSPRPSFTKFLENVSLYNHNSTILQLLTSHYLLYSLLTTCYTYLDFYSIARLYQLGFHYSNHSNLESTPAP